MTDVLDWAVVVAIGAVTVILGLGIFALFRGGDFGRSWSNKLMRLRVLAQAIAVALLLVGFWFKTQGA